MMPLPIPEMFGRGVVSTRYETVAAAQAADGTVVFARACPGTLSTQIVLCATQWRNGRWTPPSVLPFSGLESDFAPQFSADGRRLTFASRRGGRLFAIWSSDRTATGWTEPRRLDTPFGDRHQLDFSASASGDGVVVTLKAGRGVIDYLKWRKDGFAPPIALDGLNKVGSIDSACLARDGSFIAFSAAGGADEILAPGAVYQRGDLYVAFRRGDGWDAPIHLPSPVNTSAAETSPRLSADGRTLLFASDRGFLQMPRPAPVGYDEIAQKIRGEQNGLSKVFGFRVSDLLTLRKRGI